MAWSRQTMLLCSVSVAPFGGCTSPSDSRIDKYADALLIAGAGLGDLTLDVTTLSDFRKNVGDGIFTLAVSDESGFDFAFKDGEISFQFLARERKVAMPRMVAGLSVKNPDDAIEYPGVIFFYDRGITGRLENTEIKRIAIFSRSARLVKPVIPQERA